MPIMDTTVFTNLVDRIGGQYKTINNAVIAMNALGPASYFNMVTGTDDPDVEVPMVGICDYADKNVNTTGLISGVGFSPIVRMVLAIQTQFLRVQFAGGIDQYCITYNIRVSDYFHNIYLLANGNAMLAKNVFATGTYTFGTVTLGSGPSIGYVAGANFGNGAVPARQAINNNYAATQLKIRVVNMGSTQCNLTISGTDPVNNLTSANVVIPANSAPGTEIPIGTTSNRFLAAGNVTFTDSNHGTAGDQYLIINIPERII